MPIENQVELCSTHYNKWKNQALLVRNVDESKKCLEKAFFWLELQTAFIILYTLEQTKGNDKEMKMKLIKAKANLSKRLADYAKNILDEID